MLGNAELHKLFRNSYAIDGVTHTLTAEWNMNRYYDTQVLNSLDQEDAIYKDYFPLESIALPRRPQKDGIIKARIASERAAFVFNSFEAAPSRINSTYMNRPERARYYISTKEDEYQYWSSPIESTIALASYEYGFVTEQTPTVMYSQDVHCNKIVIGLEHNVSQPVNYSILVFQNGAWVTVATTPVINSDGQIILYWDGTLWGNTPSDQFVDISGVQLKVSSMMHKRAYLDVIEISARLEMDLSDRLINWSSNFEQSDVSFMAPIGRGSTNEASLKLDNIDGAFSNQNPDSMYMGLLDKGVKMTLDMTIFNTPIRQFTMYTDKWPENQDKEVEVSVFDSTKRMLEDRVPPVMWENLTIGAIIWRLCDMFGYTNYVYHYSDDGGSMIVPYYWTDDRETLWESITRLAEQTQTIIYFDEYDILQIKTKKAAYGGGIDWTFCAVDQIDNIADIEELSPKYEYEANQVDVRYSPTSISEYNNGLPIMETVWAPEDTLTLRATTLAKHLMTGDTYIQIKQTEALIWPYEGLINIEGEVVRYAGKQYSYTDMNGATKLKVVKDQEEKELIDTNPDGKLHLGDPNYIYRNYFTGRFLITKRGEFGTVETAHIISAQPFTGPWQSTLYNGAFIPWRPGPTSHPRWATWNVDEGSIRIGTPANQDFLDYYLVHTKPPANTIGYNGRYGTRLKFTPDQFVGHGIAGLMIFSAPGGVGLYITVHTTSLIERLGREISSGEISLAFKHPNGNTYIPEIHHKISGPKSGVETEILVDKWYDLEVTMNLIPGVAGVVEARTSITILLNGIIMKNYLLPLSTYPLGYPNAFYGWCGVFGRGPYTKVDFDYLYGIDFSPNLPPEKEEGFSILDLKEGGYVSTYVDQHLSQYFNQSGVNTTALKSNWNARFFDEFIPICHEMREFDIEYTKSPNLHASIYLSNNRVYCPEFNSNPFGAQFVLSNASRGNEIVNGEDSLTFEGVANVQQKCFVYGRLISADEEEIHTVRDESAIKRRGVSSIEFSSQSFQTKTAAEDLGQWIVSNWSSGVDEIELSVFGNPFIQVGDMTNIYHPNLEFTEENNKYLVVTRRQSWNNGLETILYLRRVVT